MKIRLTVLIALLFIFSLTCFAHRSDLMKDFKPASSNILGSEFSRIDSQSRFIFRVVATYSQKINVDILHVYKMSKENDSVLTVTTNPFPSGFHYYYLMIDGYRFADSASESFYGIDGMMSGIEILAPDQDFYTPKNIPYGQISECYYFSKVRNGYNRFYVYTPLNYGKEVNKEYPVLYLKHGIGEDETSWVNQGKANIIIDNLIAEGYCKPMLVVMSNGECSNLFKPKPGQELNEARKEFGAKFTLILLNEIIPYVDKNFRVFTDKDHRALTGLSVGGYQTFQIGLSKLDKFSCIRAFSCFAPFNADKKLKAVYKDVVNDITKFNKKVHVFFLGIGSEEGPRKKKFSDDLTKAEIHNIYYVSQGSAYEWLTLRRCLHEFSS